MLVVAIETGLVTLGTALVPLGAAETPLTEILSVQTIMKPLPLIVPRALKGAVYNFSLAEGPTRKINFIGLVWFFTNRWKDHIPGSSHLSEPRANGKDGKSIP